MCINFRSKKGPEEFFSRRLSGQTSLVWEKKISSSTLTKHDSKALKFQGKERLLTSILKFAGNGIRHLEILNLNLSFGVGEYTLKNQNLLATL